MADLILPETIDNNGFNPKARIPFGVTTAHIHSAMQDFVDFLSLIDTQLHAKKLGRFEDMLMQANFSSIVGEVISASIPKYCKSVAKNRYHNGHPDMLPAGKYPNDSAQHAGKDGIEIKASRYLKAWQGHNAEDVWLMVFVFQTGRERGEGKEGANFRILACGWSAAIEEGLALRGQARNESPDDHGQCYERGYSENDGELDLQV